jgi:predicted  nucleic acid-binding Zn-ribbon protein
MTLKKVVMMWMFCTYAYNGVLAQANTNLQQLPSDSLNTEKELIDLKKYLSDISLPKLNLDPKQLKKGKHTQTDSVKPWQKYVNSTQGRFSLGYDIGQLPNYTINGSENPMQLGYTEGMISNAIFDIPIMLSWKYATIKNPVGVNNYVRVSLDAEKIKSYRSISKDKITEGIQAQVEDLQQYKNKINGKLGYVEVLKQQLLLRIASEKTKLLQQQVSLNKIELPDSVSALDSTTSKIDKAQQKKQQIQDSINQVRAKYAEMQEQITKRRKQIEDLQQKVAELQVYIDKIYGTYQAIDSMQNKLGSQKDFLLNEIEENALKQVKSWGNLKKMDIGLAYPKTSALTKNTMPMKGVDLEFQKGKWFYGLTAGETMNNLMVTNNALQNSLQNTSNLFNQFDFQSIKNKRLIAITKFGKGEKEKNHTHFTLRYMNKAIITGEYTADSTLANPAAVSFEIDSRWIPKFSKSTAFDIVYGKTSAPSLASDTLRQSPFTSLFSTYRSNTALLRCTQQFPIIRSSLSAQMRFLDAHADIASMGVLQPNNMRIELQSKHEITTGTKVGLSYRSDQNNVNREADTTSKMDVFGMNLSSAWKNKININGQFNILNQHVQSSLAQSNTINYMSSCSVSANFKAKGYRQILSAQANAYKITTVNGLTQLLHADARHQVFLASGSQSFSIAFFSSQFPNELQKTQTWMMQEVFDYTFKTWTLSLGAKAAISSRYGVQFGGHLALACPLTKELKFTLRSEKLIMGDFYSSYNEASFTRFPFYIQSALTFQLK